jgi:hypothetical protein
MDLTLSAVRHSGRVLEFTQIQIWRMDFNRDKTIIVLSGKAVIIVPVTRLTPIISKITLNILNFFTFSILLF